MLTVLQEHVHKGELDFAVKEFCFGVLKNFVKSASYKTVGGCQDFTGRKSCQNFEHREETVVYDTGTAFFKAGTYYCW